MWHRQREKERKKERELRVKVREGKIKVGCCIVSQSIFKNVHVLGSIRCLKNILFNKKNEASLSCEIFLFEEVFYLVYHGWFW